MSFNSYDWPLDSDANYIVSSNMDCRQPSINFQSNMSISETMKNAQVRNWLTQNSFESEHFYDAENNSNIAPNDQQCSTNNSNSLDHIVPLSYNVTPQSNYQEHTTSLGINDSPIEDCGNINILSPIKLQEKQGHTPISVENDICLSYTAAPLLNSPCNSKANCMYLMWEITTDPTKRAQLESLPVTSLESYKKLIRQNPNMSCKAQTNLLQVLDDLRDMNERTRSLIRSNVEERPSGDTEIVFGSSVNKLQPVIQYSEPVTFSDDNMGNYSTSALIPVTENKCTSGTEENYQAKKANSSHYSQYKMPTADRYGDINYPYGRKNKRRQTSNSLNRIKRKKPNEKCCAQFMSSNCFAFGHNRHVLHQQLVYSQKTSAQLSNLDESTMNTSSCLDKPTLQKFSVTSENVFNAEFHMCDNSGNLKNELNILQGSNHLHEASRDSANDQGGHSTSDQVPLQTTEDDSQEDTLFLQCISTSLYNTENWQDLSSELDEEPLTLESSSPTVQSLESSSPMSHKPRHISEDELAQENASTRLHNTSTVDIAPCESKTLLDHSVIEHKNSRNSSLSDNGTFVLRYKIQEQPQQLPDIYGVTVHAGFEEQQAKIPSFVDTYMQAASGVNMLSNVDEPHLLEQNDLCAMNNLSINSMVTNHNGPTQCHCFKCVSNFNEDVKMEEWKDNPLINSMATNCNGPTQCHCWKCVSNFNGNENMEEGSLLTNQYVDNSGSLDMTSGAEYPTGVSSSLVASDREQNTQDSVFFESSSSNSNQRGDSNQSSELNLISNSFQYILFDISGSLATVE